MNLPKFEHVSPGSIQAAAQLLAEYGDRAVLVAGGTDIYPRMKYRLLTPAVVVSLKRIPAIAPRLNAAGDLQLDALTTLAELVRSPLVSEKAPLLSEAAWNVGSNQTRHMGTLGGNLCQENRCLYYNQTHVYQFVDPCYKRRGNRCYLFPAGKKCWAVFCSDMATALISLQARVDIIGADQNRQLPLEEVYTADALHPLSTAHGEIISEIIVPVTDVAAGNAFVKMSRRGGVEFAGLNLAVQLNMNDDGVRCASACITVGSFWPGPQRCVKAEQVLAGESFSDDLFRAAAQRVKDDVRIFPHHAYSVQYLKQTLEVLARRAFAQAAKRVLGRDDRKK